MSLKSDIEGPRTPRKAREILVQNPFSSPAKEANVSVSGSPRKSPEKRGLIGINGFYSTRTVLLPVRTPNGRAGSLSPGRRNMLDQSARKKAILAGSLYERLKAQADEDEDYMDRQVKEQEMQFADMVAGKRGTRNGGSFTWAELNYEEDILLATPRTRSKRRRTRKKIVEEVQLDTSDSELDVNDFEDSEDEYIPKKAKKQKKKSSKNSSSASENEDDDDLDDENIDDKSDLDIEVTSLKEEILHKKPGRKPGRKSTRKSKDVSTSPFVSETTPEDVSPKKMGRPTKSEGVLGKIKSIFDGDYKTSPKGKSSPKVNREEDITSLIANLYESGIPTISGIKRDRNKEVEDQRKSFVKMPLPTVDADGNITDQAYLDKYFSDSVLSLQQHEKVGDEKAFYMEGSEGYFEQHSIRVRPSSNSISQLAPDIDYDEFTSLVTESNKIARQEKLALAFARKSLYNQWCFELEQGFNINFYGVGSKMNTIMDFVTGHLLDKLDHIYKEAAPSVLVVNGFNPTLKLKKVVQDILSCFVPKESSIKYPKHISDTVTFLKGLAAEQRKLSGGKNQPRLILVIHNVDGERLRDDKSQDLLSQVCGIPEVWTITSTDNINVSALWDLYKAKNFNFIWHDLTTFEPYINEMSFKDVLSMGRSKKFVGNKGAKFVLSSLTDNQRDVYRIMLRHQIEKILVGTNKKARSGLRGNVKFGIPFKMLYDSCVEDFVVSNEVNLRSMVGEFVEHKMAKLTKDESGTEIVFIPFNFDEMERVLQAEFNESIAKEDV